jgi:hypothetical protein
MSYLSLKTTDQFALKPRYRPMAFLDLSIQIQHRQSGLQSVSRAQLLDKRASRHPFIVSPRVSGAALKLQGREVEKTPKLEHTAEVNREVVKHDQVAGIRVAARGCWG